MWRPSTWSAIALCAGLACGSGNNTPPLADAPPGYMGPVTLEVDNHAAGIVQSTPPGIMCPTVCSAMFEMGTEVTLQFRPTNSAQYLKAQFDELCDKRGDFACSITIAHPTRINMYGLSATVTADPPTQ
jgi:hypothetical protein